ncbi:hypothetical protein IW262DRAFT_283150 [Armillaria fumosa]|nr:hypothetical protein IW262DRAFT_283150 [Armillaria fumosa]
MLSLPKRCFVWLYNSFQRCSTSVSPSFYVQASPDSSKAPSCNMEWIKRTSRAKPQIEQDGVDLAVMAVDILKAAAEAATSIPALGTAAGIVSCIMQQISQAQQNTELALKSAARCARALATISQHLEMLVITSAVLENIKSFEEDLYEIQDFIENETSRSIFYLTIFAKRRAGQIQELQSRV